MRFSLSCILILFAIFCPISHLFSASIIGSRHDLSYTGDIHNIYPGEYEWDVYKEVCVYCHTPHNAVQDVPLWNRNYTSSSFTPYQSESVSAPATPSASSLLCISCHDGVTAVDQVVNTGSGLLHSSTIHTTLTDCYECHTNGDCNDCHPGWYPRYHTLGNNKGTFTDLSDDHPISVPYRSSPELVIRPASGVFPNGIRLIDDKVECPSCHDVHDPGIKPFLRTSNAGSAICYTCHVK